MQHGRAPGPLPDGRAPVIFTGSPAAPRRHCQMAISSRPQASIELSYARFAHFLSSQGPLLVSAQLVFSLSPFLTFLQQLPVTSQHRHVAMDRT
jgi:hypothetical protein